MKKLIKIFFKHFTDYFTKIKPQTRATSKALSYQFLNGIVFASGFLVITAISYANFANGPDGQLPDAAVVFNKILRSTEQIDPSVDPNSLTGVVKSAEKLVDSTGATVVSVTPSGDTIIANKATSSSTIAADTATTLTTKDYVDTAIAAAVAAAPAAPGTGPGSFYLKNVFRGPCPKLPLDSWGKPVHYSVVPANGSVYIRIEVCRR